MCFWQGRRRIVFRKACSQCRTPSSSRVDRHVPLTQGPPYIDATYLRCHGSFSRPHACLEASDLVCPDSQGSGLHLPECEDWSLAKRHLFNETEWVD